MKKYTRYLTSNYTDAACAWCLQNFDDFIDDVHTCGLCVHAVSPVLQQALANLIRRVEYLESCGAGNNERTTQRTSQEMVSRALAPAPGPTSSAHVWGELCKGDEASKDFVQNSVVKLRLPKPPTLNVICTGDLCAPAAWISETKCKLSPINSERRQLLRFP